MSQIDATSPTTINRPFKVASRPGRLRVQVVNGPLYDVNLENGPGATFGRSRAADVVIEHHSVSKIHFSLRVVDDGIELKDLGSKNGTWYANRPTRHTILQPGDDFWAGACQIKIVDVDQVDIQVSAEPTLGPLIGRSVPMRELFATLITVAPSHLDLLLTGETGTGKGITARTIHDLSDRAAGPFVKLDCANLPASLAEAAMFGVSRGAYTGANEDVAGFFEEAHGGTLFIDEIGELDLNLQLRFLTAIDCRQVARLGKYAKVRDVDVRIVAATNRNLLSDVREGRFREDLFHRIGSHSLRLPALRERSLDILPLAEHFLQVNAKRRGRVAPTLSDDAKVLLMTYQWPGNVRELNNALSWAEVVCRNGVIRSEDVKLSVPDGWAHKVARCIDDQEPPKYKELHMMIDRIFLPTVLKEEKTLKAAADRLDLKPAWLRERLRALDLRGIDEG